MYIDWQKKKSFPKSKKDFSSHWNSSQVSWDNPTEWRKNEAQVECLEITLWNEGKIDSFDKKKTANIRVFLNFRGNVHKNEFFL